eukprot:COSAG02_NODE_3462_length_6697_cov_102.238523_1_plen_82_part_00
MNRKCSLTHRTYYTYRGAVCIIPTVLSVVAVARARRPSSSGAHVPRQISPDRAPDLHGRGEALCARQKHTGVRGDNGRGPS